MAQCDTGYFCHVCGAFVDGLGDSDLYLRYVLGRVPLDALYHEPDAHVWCNPALAQFIVDDAYSADPAGTARPVHPDRDKARLDEAARAAEEALVTRAWQRLQRLPELGVGIHDYPLPDLAEEAR